MSKKHAIWMVLCCVVGMGAVLAITVFRVPVNSLVTVGLLLLCPLSHVLMMGMMGKNHDHGQESMPDHTHHQPSPVDVKAKPASRSYLPGQE